MQLISSNIGFDINTSRDYSRDVFNNINIQALEQDININGCIEELLNIKPEGSLFYITQDFQKNNNWKGITIIHDNICISLDKYLIQDLLNNSLGESPTQDSNNFSCKKLTQLEQNIILDLIENINNNINNNTENTAEIITLVWGFPTGKLYISLPASYINKYKTLNNINRKYYKELLVNSSIVLGKTKLSLKEINNIEDNDIIILEDSINNTASLLGINNINQVISVNSNNIQKLNYNLDEIISMNTSNIQENNTVEINDFEIELQAEFRDVSMRLSELDKLQAGQVIDLASLQNNIVYLSSQGKTIAQGQLMLIDNKFAIRIGDIIMQDKVIKPEITVTNTEETNNILPEEDSVSSNSLDSFEENNNLMQEDNNNLNNLDNMDFASSEPQVETNLNEQQDLSLDNEFSLDTGTDDFE